MQGFIVMSLSVGFLSYAAPSFSNMSAERGDQNIERIEVVGQRSLALFRSEYTQAQFALFDTFNQLIDDPDMHYICERKRRMNSRLHYTHCVDAFDKRIRDELFRSEMGKAGDLMSKLSAAQVSSKLGSMEIIRLKDEKEALLQQLYEENDQFRQAASELIESKRRYEKAHAALFGSMSQFADKY